MKDRIIRLSLKFKLDHLLFWVISLVSMTYLFKINETAQKIDYIYSSLLHLPVLMVVYVNIFWLIPKYLNKKKVFNFAIGICLCICIGGYLQTLIFDHFLEIILPDYFFVNDFNFWDYCLLLFIYLAISSFAKISKLWYQSLELVKQSQYFELEALKQQMNPHFFFNTLNSLYGLSLTQHEKTPEAILQLSNIMRYVIYESNKPLVSLTQEIEMIRDYLAIVAIRNVNVEQNIFIDLPELKEDLSIAPNLIIPLIENAIKHRSQDLRINVTMKIHKSEITIQVSNSYDEIRNQSNGGIGLQNLQRRLELLYKRTDLLKITQDNKQFTVFLTIPINHSSHA